MADAAEEEGLEVDEEKDEESQEEPEPVKPAAKATAAAKPAAAKAGAKRPAPPQPQAKTPQPAKKARADAGQQKAPASAPPKVGAAAAAPSNTSEYVEALKDYIKSNGPQKMASLGRWVEPGSAGVRPRQCVEQALSWCPVQAAAASAAAFCAVSYLPPDCSQSPASNLPLVLPTPACPMQQGEAP